jgi:hypothetical protein
MDDRSLTLLLADRLVMGVLAILPFVDSAGVDVAVSDLPLTLAACFAAFSARRFCFDAEGAMGGQATRNLRRDTIQNRLQGEVPKTPLRYSDLSPF